MAFKLRAGIHARRSLNRADEQSASVRRQIAAGKERAAHLGAEVVDVFDEDDTSAFKKRVVKLPDGRSVRRNVRPEWQRALRALYDGDIDVLIEYDLDRAMREPRDLEDLIEVVEMTGRQVESVTGSLRLRNDADITMARVMVAMANKSSRDTSRRVRDSAKERAALGKNHGGRRCFGYTLDGLDAIPTEAAEVTRVFEQFVSGVPLGAIVRDLNSRGVSTVTGRPWVPNSLRGTMLTPRHAGLASYKGEVVGKGQWPAIVSEELWRSAVALLQDPARRTSTGNRASYLLSGIATCGVCDGPITSAGLKKSGPEGGYRYIYRCRPRPGKAGYCVGRRRDWVDTYVEEAVFSRLIRDDVAELLIDDKRPDLEGLLEEQETIRRQLDDAAASFARRVIDDRQLEIISKTLRPRLEEISRLTASTSRPVALQDLVEASLGAAEEARYAAVEAVWKQKTLDQRRAIVQELMSVVLHPGGGGKRTFDPTKVQIVPK
jgi:DNA invertase Pin-like site-specific DNA recombinase